MSALKTVRRSYWLAVMVTAVCGACSSVTPLTSDGGGGTSGGSSAGAGGQAGSSGAAGRATGAGGGGTAGGGATGGAGMGGAGGAADGGAMTCADLAARAAALLSKDCTSSDQCAVTTIYNCCTVYTGIRADAKAAFESAQTEHTRACPDLRGCQCQDHTETNELVPVHQPPLPVSATCDLGKCTAHQK